MKNAAAVLVLLAFGLRALAAPLAYDGFSTNHYAAGQLKDQNPSIAGFTNAWFTGPNVYAGGSTRALTWPGLDTDDTGGAYNALVGNRCGRQFATALGGNATYYISLLMKKEVIDTNYRSLELHNFGSRNLQVGANGDIDGTGTRWGMRALDNNSLRATSSVSAVAGETVLAVIKATFSTTSGADAVRLWINPEDMASEEGSTNYVELTGLTFVNNNFERFHFAAYNGSSTAYWDEVRVGTMWEDVLPAPQDPTYVVTYDGNGSTGGSAPTDGTLYTNGQEVTVMANTGPLVRVNHTFTGWNTLANGSGTVYGAGTTFTMGTASLTLYAQWTQNAQPDGTHVVNYGANGATTGAVPVDPNYYAESNTVTVLGNTGGLVKLAHTFDGWNTAADGSGTGYVADDTFEMGTNDVTLYAQWAFTPSTGKPVRVFVLAGQSNMRGTGTSVSHAPEAWNPLAGVLFDDTTTSEPGSYSTNWEVIGTATNYMGPEMGLAATLREAYTNDTIAIVKVSQSATGLDFWRNPGQAGHDTLMARIAATSNRLAGAVASNDIPSWSYAGFVWMQGENEADGALGPSESYGVDFADMAAKVRTATGVTNLPVVMGRISIQLDPAVSPGVGPVSQPQLDNVRTNQVGWAETDPYAGWVNTDDLPLIDSWHFGNIGQLLLGQRLAEAWFDVVEPRPTLNLRRAASQATRTMATSILYQATFSLPVTGFTPEQPHGRLRVGHRLAAHLRTAADIAGLRIGWNELQRQRAGA